MVTTGRTGSDGTEGGYSDLLIQQIRTYMQFIHSEKYSVCSSKESMLTVIQLVGLDDLHRVVRYAAALNLQNQHRVYTPDLKHRPGSVTRFCQSPHHY